MARVEAFDARSEEAADFVPLATGEPAERREPDAGIEAPRPKPRSARSAELDAGDAAAGPDHPGELAKRGRRIVDVTEEIGEGEVVERAVVEREGLGLADEQLDAGGERRIGVELVPSPLEHRGALVERNDAAPVAADQLRGDENAVHFVRSFFEQGKPVGVICHGPWTLIDAGVAKGRTLTSWPTLRTDLTNAGANWVDEEVHVDNGLVTSRKPDDLPAFCRKLVEELAEGTHQGQMAAVGAQKA